VPARWASRRALLLHLAVVVWVPLCVVLGWWQATRALDGNTLSYVYSVEWPLLAVVGVWVWWVLIHTDPDKVGARAQRRARAEQERVGKAPALPERRRDEEDEALAAYNDHLEALAADDRPKTWRHT
jgi:DNA-binding transcriptional regulator of glucitol operon